MNDTGKHCLEPKIENTSVGLLPNKRRYTPGEAKSLLAGRCQDFLRNVGFDAGGLNSSGGPCPKCGGTDRFSLHKDFVSNGRVFCRKCFSRCNGDVLATAVWWTEWKFPEIMQAVSDYLDGATWAPLEQLTPPAPTKPRKRSEPTPAGLNSDFAEWVERSEKLAPQLIAFAQERGVDWHSLIAFGFRKNGPNISFPERYPSGRVSGEVTRYAAAQGKNRYRCGKGHRRRFGYPLQWFEHYPVVLIPEGVIDAVALHSAGIDAISRPSLESDLRPLAPMLAAFPRHWRIVVMLENDSPDVMLEHLSKVEKRATELAIEAKRDVWVGRYPERRGKDANDCWLSVTAEVGDRIKAGKLLLDEILELAHPVEWAGPIIAANIEEAEQIADMHLAFASRRRQEERATKEDSACGFYKTHKRSKGDGTQVMSSAMMCSRWCCWRCRQRLIDGWYVHLLAKLAELQTVYVAVLQAEDGAAMGKLQRAMTARIKRSGGQWVIINQRDFEEPLEDAEDAEPLGVFSREKEVVVLSSVETRETSKVFSLTRDGVAPLAGYLLSMVSLADHTISRPIRTVRSWSRCEKPSIEDWISKLRRITTGQGHYSGLAISCGVTSAEGAKAIRKACREGKKNYIGVRLPDGREWIATDLVRPNLNTEAAAIHLDGAELSVGQFFASGAWYARPSGGWEPVTTISASGEVTPVNVGPDRLRETAKKFRLPVFDVPVDALSAADSRAVVGIRQDEKNTEEKFISAL